MNRPAQLRRGLIAFVAAAVFGLMATPAHAAEVQPSSTGTATQPTVGTMSQASPRDDCWALAASPWRNGGTIRFDGWLSCLNYGQWSQARVSVEVYANGGANYLGKTERTCYADLDGKRCDGYTATWSYSPGNWCTVVQVYIWPSNILFQDKSCRQI